MKRLLSILSVAGIAAASAAMIGQAHAADALVVVPETSTQPHVATSEMSRQTAEAVVVEERADARDSNAVVITPDHDRIRAAVYERDDGTLVIPTEGAVLSAPKSVEPTGYSRAANDVFRVYDCDTIDSSFEWDACVVGSPQ